MKSAPYKIISGQKWTKNDWNDSMKYAPEYDAVLDSELPQTEKECREDKKDLLMSALPNDVKIEWCARYDAQLALLRDARLAELSREEKGPECSTQVELLLDAVRQRKFGASLQELIADARRSWPLTPRTIAQSVCRLLHNHCAESRGYKGKRNLFSYQTVGKRKVWFAR